MESNILVSYFIGIIVIFFVGRLFIVPLKYIFKLILNSIFGGVFILLINLIGGNFGFHIGLNLITAIFVGLLGIPGSIVLILLKLMLG